jgi:hypothetical protein
MAWTYDASDLDKTTATGRRNVVRLLVGDTNTSDQQVQDEEIVFSLSETNNNVYSAAGWVARTISGKYSRQVTIGLDDQLTAEYSVLSSNYALLADRLEYQGKKTSGSMGMIGGGISKTDVDAVRQNSDRVTPAFRKDQFSNLSDLFTYYDPND